MPGGRHFCTVCRSWYRSWPRHVTSQRHMQNVRRKANPSTSRKGIRGAFKPHRARGRQQGDDMVSVDDYYRNPPTPPWPASIKDKVHYVVHHWRHAPYVAHRATWRPKGRRRR